MMLAAGHVATAADSKGDPPPEKRIVISIAERKLVLLEGERVVRVYDTAVGTPSTPTPSGEFQIVNRLMHPTWFGPRKVVAPGKGNPLGTRWMGLSKAGYGIHGTNVPASIGTAASHGCIRMRNQDVEDLYQLVQTGVVVEILSGQQERFTRLLTASKMQAAD
ncbi:MAG: L,D-transpeptidase [Acidobacteria bacterium]|nr:L,D-transpeptidase [Acidobacteriota bacterium]